MTPHLSFLENAVRPRALVVPQEESMGSVILREVDGSHFQRNGRRQDRARVLPCELHGKGAASRNAAERIGAG